METNRSDSPVMGTLSKITDLVLLNIITLVCCIPVITAGAALTGMHYVLRKMVKKEEGYIVRPFFRSFRENFLQATALWCLFLLFLGIFAADLVLTRGGGQGEAAVQMPFVLRLLILAGGIYVCFAYLYVFPVLARFRNTAAGTLRTAFRLAAGAFPRTLGMAAATLAMPLAVSFAPVLFPLILLAGLSAPGLVCAFLYTPLFEKIEGRRV